MKWHILALTLIAVVGVAFAAILIAAQQGAEFTAQEKAMLERLEPVLDTLVLHEEDLSSLSGDYEVCEGGEPYSIQYDYERNSADVEDVRRVESDDHPTHDSAFCDFDSGAFVSSTVALPESKEHLLALRGVHRDLAHGESGGFLQKLAEIASDDLLPEEELLDYRWLNAPSLGNTGYAWVRTVNNLDTGEQLEIYHFHFTRSIVLAGLQAAVPSSPTAENEALLLARTFDNRIAAQLELLRPEVQAR